MWGRIPSSRRSAPLRTRTTKDTAPVSLHLLTVVGNVLFVAGLFNDWEDIAHDFWPPHPPKGRFLVQGGGYHE